MRFKERPNYREISMRSMQRDMQRGKSRDNPKKEHNEEPQRNSTRRILSVGESSGYYKFRHLITGKLVRLVEQSSYGGWLCEFVHDEDSRKLNQTAGWSESKKMYLFDCVKFK